MSKQTQVKFKTCQHKSICDHEATYGVFRWAPGDTDINMDKPVRVFCGKHKPHCETGTNQRLVKLKR